jgi:hypothetical protein
MGAGNAGSGGGDKGKKDTQTFGYETEINKQKEKEKAQKEAFGNYDKSNTNPNNNIQNKTKNTTNNNNGGGNDGNNTIAQVTATAPTVSEVSQATTTEAVADTEANRLLKIKKKGRSQSIMSGSQGVTKTSADYSLGKSSLLGKV